MRTIKKGATSQSVYVDVLDSTSTTGGRKTGLAFNTSSLVAYYVRSQGTATAITLATLAAANTAWSSGGFKEVDSANMPGIYRLDVPDAAFATGAGDDLVVVLKGATGMVQASCDVQLVAWDPQDTVRAGLTALPNAAAEAAGGLFTRGTGAGQINQDANGRVDVNGKAWAGGAIPAPNVTGVPIVDDKYLLGTIYSTPATAGIQDINLKNIANAAVSTSTAQLGVNAVNHGGTAQTGRDIGASVLLSAGTGTGQLDFTTGVVKANLAQILGTALTETAGLLAGGFKKFFNVATPAATMDHGVLVDTVTTYTGNTPQTGDAYARIGSAGSGLTALGDTRIAHLDADVSTRSTYAGGDTSGTTTLLSRLTSTRAGLLDHLDADISSRMATFSYTAPLDAAGTRTAVGLASANLDTQIGTLATASALSTVNTTVNGINAKTTNLPSDPADASDIGAAFTALASHGDGAWATATGFSTLDAAGVENAVWDAVAADHVAGGSLGGVTNDIASAVGTIEGRIGTPAFGDLAGDIAHAQGSIDVIDAKTTNLPTDPADESLIIAATDAIMGRLGAPSGASLSADVADLPTNAEMDTKLAAADDAVLAAIAALTIPTASANAAALLAAAYEGSESVQDFLRLSRAALFGVGVNLDTSSPKYKSADGNTDRIVVTGADANGNRPAVTLDPA